MKRLLVPRPAPAVAVVMCALLSVGCVPVVQSTRLAAVPGTPLAPTAPVAMFTSQAPWCAYDEVALVSVKPLTKLTSTDKLMEALRDRARKEGADGIINVKLDTPVNGYSDDLSGNGSVNVERTRVLSGTAVRFRDPNCTH